MVDKKMYSHQTIHLAVDGSGHSIAAAQIIRDMPLPPSSKVVILGVLSRRHSPSRYLLLAALDEAHKIIQEKHAHVTSGLLHGNPDHRLIEFANRHRPNLVVIGAKGLRATLGVLLGGVAQQVVEYVHKPVLVVRAPYTGIKNVLLTVDGSKHSLSAAEFLAHFPIPEGANVHVMTVLPPIPEPEKPAKTIYDHFYQDIPASDSFENEQTIGQLVESEEQQGKAALAETINVLRAAGIEATSSATRGDTFAEVFEYIKANRIDLVVAGYRGQTPVKSWLLGSVSRKLVHYAGCSVLIVKSPQTKAR